MFESRPRRIHKTLQPFSSPHSENRSVNRRSSIGKADGEWRKEDQRSPLLSLKVHDKPQFKGFVEERRRKYEQLALEVDLSSRKFDIKTRSIEKRRRTGGLPPVPSPRAIAAQVMQLEMLEAQEQHSQELLLEQAKLARLEAEVRRLVTENEQLQSLLSAKDLELVQAQAQQSHVAATLSHESAKIEKLTTKLERAQSELENARHLADEIKQTSSLALAEKDVRISQLQAEVEAKVEALGLLNIQLAEAVKSHQAELRKAIEMQTVKEEMQRTIDHMQDQLRNLDDYSKEQIAFLEAQVAQLKAKPTMFEPVKRLLTKLGFHLKSKAQKQREEEQRQREAVELHLASSYVVNHESNLDLGNTTAASIEKALD